MSPRLQRILLILLIAYFMLFGGNVHTELSPLLRVVHQWITFGLLALWLLDLVRRGRGLPQTPLDLPLLLYLGAWLLAALFALDARVSLEYAWRIVAEVLGFYLLVDLMRRGRQRWVIEAVFIVGLVVIVVSLVEFMAWYFGQPLIPQFMQGWPQVGAGPLPPGWHKVALALSVSTWVGNYCAVLLPLAAAWAMTTPRRDLRLAGWLLAALLLLVLVLSGSRGALVGAIGAAGVLTVTWLLRADVRGRFPAGLRPLLDRRLLLAAMALGLIVLAGVMFWTAARSEQSGDANRLDLWRSALAMTADHPLLGVGPNQFGAALRIYGDPERSLSQSHLLTAHDLPLNTLAEGGLLTLAAVLILGGAFARAGWRAWQSASLARRRRLEGVLAAFVTFGLHSLVDTFPYTIAYVIILVMAAYTLAGDVTRSEAVIKRERATVNRRRLAGIVLAALLVAQIAFLPVHAGDLAFRRVDAALAAGDTPAALEAIHAAEAADPALGLYPLAEAYLLGLLAEDDPAAYLDEAIAAHEGGLSTINATWDRGWHNLAALYAQAGRYEDAIRAESEAIRWNPTEAGYHLRLGEYHEALDQATEARAAFLEALRRQPEVMASSGFWSDPAHPDRAALRDELVADLQSAGEWMPTRLPWQPYLEHAEAVLDGMDPTASYRYGLTSEQAARAALFISEGEARRAWFVLAQLAERQGAAEDAVLDLLVRAAPVISERIGFPVVVFGRGAPLYVLPQARYPVYSRADLEPLQALAERLAAQGRDPVPAYNLLLVADPYRWDVRAALAP